MERRFSAHASASLIACALAASAAASPTKAPAKKLFDQALAAYGKGDYTAAIDALSKSFALQADPDTLFAWAQAERKIGDCGKAIELYDKLLVYHLPAENREAASTARSECQKIINDTAAEVTMDPKTPEPTTTEPAHAPTTEQPPPVTPAQLEQQANDHDTPFGGHKAPAPEQPVDNGSGGGGRAWWRDPVGDTLVGVGVVGVGVGAALLASAIGANNDKKTAASYGQFQTLQNRANSEGTVGVTACIAGGAFIAGGIVWYATHRGHDARPAVTGWLAPGGGGLAVAGGF